MKDRIWFGFGLGVAGILGLGACDDESTVLVPDAGTDTLGGGTDALTPDAVADAAPSGLGFAPSNLPAGFNFNRADDVVAEGANCIVIAEPMPVATSACMRGATRSVARLSDGTEAVVLSMRNLEVRRNAEILFQGAAPVIFAASGRVTIEGTIRVGPTSTSMATGVAGGADGGMQGMPGRGPGAGGGANAATNTGAGGGAFCGRGGGGKAGAQNGGAMTYGTPALVPLVGGSSGAGATSRGGAGGGALQITAGIAIDLRAGAVITAGGGGGERGAGGGSGGAILLEAPMVGVAGVLAANGGGGGGNGIAGNFGQVGQPSAMAAQGGIDPSPANGGGAGSAGTMVDGSPGAYASAPGTPIPDHGGGGGGGAGRIRINTMTGQAAITGTVSPALGTACATQGMLN